MNITEINMVVAQAEKARISELVSKIWTAEGLVGHEWLIESMTKELQFLVEKDNSRKQSIKPTPVS